VPEKSRSQPHTYLRNIQKGKREKKSWYQYVFLASRLREEGEAEDGHPTSVSLSRATSSTLIAPIDAHKRLGSLAMRELGRLPAGQL
jgi:hypothetical protein